MMVEITQTPKLWVMLFTPDSGWRWGLWESEDGAEIEALLHRSRRPDAEGRAALGSLKSELVGMRWEK